MKKYLFLLLLIPGVYLAYQYREEKKVSLAPKTTAPISAIKAKTLFKSKRTPLARTAEKTTFNDCDILQENLDHMDFNQSPQEWLSAVSVEDMENCQLPEFQDKIGLVKASCGTEKMNQDQCLESLIVLRALLRSKWIKDPGSREEMADLILAEFSRKEPDFKKLAEFSKRFLEQDPADPTMQKVWAMTHLISQGDITKLPPEVKEEIYSRVDPELLRTDQDLRGLDVVFKTGLDPAKLEKFTNDRLKENPNDSATREMLGWSLWKQGRRAEALAQLDVAISQKPDDPWLQDLRRKLLAPDANAGTYVGRLNIGVKLDDLFK